MADLKRRIIAEFSAKNKAKGEMASFRRGLDRTGQAMKRMAKVGAVMALAAAAGLAYMVKRQMEAIDVIAKLSDRLGIATEDLVGLQHAASISGVSTESLNKSLDMFVRRLGEMTMGSGEAKRGLEMLGLTMEELIRLSPAEAMGIAADRINQLETQAEKAAASYFLFGRAGAQLVTMFAVGSEGLREFQREAEKLGLTFSRLDAAQIEAANDALTRARATMTGLFRQATIELAPYIEALADKFVDVATAGEGLGANVTRVFEVMSIGAIKFGESLNEIPAALSSIKAAMYDVVSFWEKMAPAGMAYGIYRKIKGQKTPSEMAAELRARAQQQKQIAAQQINAIQKFYDDLRKKAAGQPDFMTTFPEVIKFEAEPFSWEKVPQKITEEQRKAAEEIDQVWTEMWLKQEETAYHAMRAPIIAAEKLAEESAERRKRISEDIALSMARGWTDALDQMMFESKKFWDALEDMARSLLREIMNIIMYKKLAEPMAYAIMGEAGKTGLLERAFTAGVGALFGAAGAGAPGGPPTTAGVRSYTLGGYGGGLQHGGEVLKTGLAMVHRGEKYSGVGGGGGNLDVHIHNEGEGKFEISEVEEYAISDQRIIDVTIRAAGTHGAYRRSIKQIRSNV